MFVTILVFFLVLSLYKYLNSSYGFWKKHGVPSPPVSLLFGNMTESLFLKKCLAEIYAQIYNDFPNVRYVGFYKIRQPAIIIRDAELIKRILITKFNSFRDNDFHIDDKVDPVFSNHPFALKGEKWQKTRGLLTQCFTLKKLKTIYPLMNKIGEKAIMYLNETNLTEIEAKELSAKYTTDVVATCMFGLEGNSFVEGKAKLLKIGTKSMSTSTLFGIQQIVISILPFLANLFDFKFISDEVAGYFRTTISEVLKYRENGKIEHDDFLGTLKKLKLSGAQITDKDIIEYSAGLFIDGFETTSVGLSFILFELAQNPTVQNKLRACLNDVRSKKGEFTFEDIIGVPYLEAVYKESLRLYPPFAYLAKICTQDFKLPAPYYNQDGPVVEIKKGVPVYFPTYAFHRDLTHVQDPEKFRPERYCDDSTNMPFYTFGDGPRKCLGVLFASLQLKTFIAHIVLNFKIRLNDRTKLPLKMDPGHFLLRSRDGIWLDFCKL